MNKKKIYDYLLSAENGDSEAQRKLCQYFFEGMETWESLPDDFWNRVDKIAQGNEDYANFIMHCRYFDDPDQSRLSYDYVRKAIRHKDVPLAILRLGVSYAGGIGIKENHVLANYFYEKALSMGCQEAEDYIEYEYDTGRRNLVHEVTKAMNKTGSPTPGDIDKFKKRIERERQKENYGVLSGLRKFLPLFYPDFDQEKGYDDILNNRDTVDASLCYALSTVNNQLEYNIDLLDDMLQQLFSPITQDEDLFLRIIDKGNEYLLDETERELLQAICNYVHSYDRVCKKNKIKKMEIMDIESMEWFPCIMVSSMALVRKQAFRCLLSVKDVDPLIKNEFLNKLDGDRDMLNVCEQIKDEDLQLFLLSFVELNIDTDSLESTYVSLLVALRQHRLDALVKRLNDFVSRLTDAGIEHHLPKFTPRNIPL